MALNVLTSSERYLRVPAGLRRLRAVPRPLALLLGAGLVLSLAWATATAPLQGPDETAHVSYVQNLAENGHKPHVASGSGTESTEVGSADYFFGLHPSVGIVNARPMWSQADRRGYAAIEKGFTPAERKNAGGPNAIAKNPLLYYLWEAGAYRVGYGLNILDRAYLLRLANIPLYLATIVFAWLLASLLFGEVWLRTTATALVALQPMLVYMSGVVNPDTMLATAWTAFAYVAVRLLLLGPSRGRMAALALAVAASFLTHGRGIAIIVPAVAAVVLSLWRHRARYPRASWAVPATLGAGAVIVGAVLKLHSAYGGELTLGPRFGLRAFGSYLWQFYFPRVGGMTPPPGPHYGFRELIVQEYLGGRFGSLEVSFSDDVYRLLQLLAVGLIVAFVVAAVKRRRALRVVWDVAALLAITVVAEMMLLHLVSFRSLVGGSGDPLIVGRYLIPLTFAYGIVGAFLAWAAGRRAGPFVAAGLVAVSLALQLGGLGLTVARFYG